MDHKEEKWKLEETIDVNMKEFFTDKMYYMNFIEPRNCTAVDADGSEIDHQEKRDDEDLTTTTADENLITAVDDFCRDPHVMVLVVRSTALARPSASAMIQCPRVSPNSVNPVQAAASRIIAQSKGVTAAPTSRHSKDQCRKGQEVGP